MTQDVAVKGTTDPFVLMDQMDDKAIVAELEGRIIDKWVYHFGSGANEVWGISKIGVDQACREMAKHGEVIREQEVNCIVDPTDKTYVLCKAHAVRVAINRETGKEVILDSAFGTKRQSMFNGGKPNPFWYEQGTQKALRNARQRLISEEIRSKILALAKKENKVDEVGANGPPPPPPPKQKASSGPADPAMKTKLQSLVAQVMELTNMDAPTVLTEASRFKAKDGSVQESRSIDPILQDVKWTNWTMKNLEKKIKEAMEGKE